LYRAVKRASVGVDSLDIGDFVVVTGVENDTAGIVEEIAPTEGTVDITLKTSSGIKILRVSNKSYIHIIRKADMLNLRDHIDYERDLEDVDKGTHEYTEKDRRPAYGPDEKSDKSELPTSKISLNLRKKVIQKSS
jgi:hypothetical protein